ncbi:MAG: UDP-N-acetylglucosamine acyltransferase [Flavobacteriales bacterium]|jgi:UDP-N-acetylglucosamine acyltransferase
MISPNASVDPKAKIASSVEIGPFTTIYGDVEIGEGTWIGPNVTIMDGARIGKHCRIFPGAVISAIPQDLKFNGEETTVEIGDHTTIRECVTINRGTTDKWSTKVGSHCLLMAYVHLAHDVFVGDYCILANTANIAGHVHIENNVIIEGVVAVQQFVRIGQHSFIAGGSLVRKNVPPFVKAAREPLTYAGVNSIGLRRRGFEDQAIAYIEDVYRTLYVHNSNMTTAVRVADVELPKSEEKDVILTFIRESTKGIIRGPV